MSHRCFLAATILRTCRQVGNGLYGSKGQRTIAVRLQNWNYVTATLTETHESSNTFPTPTEVLSTTAADSKKFIPHKSLLPSCSFVFRSCRRDAGISFVILIWGAARQVLRQSKWAEHSLESNRRRSISTSLVKESSERMPITTINFPKCGN